MNPATDPIEPIKAIETLEEIFHVYITTNSYSERSENDRSNIVSIYKSIVETLRKTH